MCITLEERLCGQAWKPMTPTLARSVHSGRSGRGQSVGLTLKRSFGIQAEYPDSRSSEDEGAIVSHVMSHGDLREDNKSRLSAAGAVKKSQSDGLTPLLSQRKRGYQRSISL